MPDNVCLTYQACIRIASAHCFFTFTSFCSLKTHSIDDSPKTVPATNITPPGSGVTTLFVGEATHVGVNPCMQGAMETGVRAANQVLACVKGPPRSRM
jgi:hypothetical protein